MTAHTKWRGGFLHVEGFLRKVHYATRDPPSMGNPLVPILLDSEDFDFVTRTQAPGGSAQPVFWSHYDPPPNGLKITPILLFDVLNNNTGFLLCRNGLNMHIYTYGGL